MADILSYILRNGFEIIISSWLPGLIKLIISNSILSILLSLLLVIRHHLGIKKLVHMLYAILKPVLFLLVLNVVWLIIGKGGELLIVVLLILLPVVWYLEVKTMLRVLKMRIVLRRLLIVWIILQTSWMLGKPAIRSIVSKYNESRVLSVQQIMDVIEITEGMNIRMSASEKWMYTPMLLGIDERNGLIIQRISYCDDICPNYANLTVVYKNVDEDKCFEIGGSKIRTPGWGGYVGCAPVLFNYPDPNGEPIDFVKNFSEVKSLLVSDQYSIIWDGGYPVTDKYWHFTLLKKVGAYPRSEVVKKYRVDKNTGEVSYENQ